jgi:hypothetical protein
MASPFVWGQGGQKMTPEQVARLRVAAELMQKEGGLTTPVASPFAGLNRVLQGYISGRDIKRSDTAEAEGLASADAAIAALLGGGEYTASSAGGGYAPTTPWVPTNTQPTSPDPTTTFAGMPDVAEGGLSLGLPAAETGASGTALGFGNVATPAPTGGSADAIFRAELAAGGLPPHIVDGIMMNAADESAFNPNAVGDGGNAFGLLQWNGPRKRALESFAASIGGNPADPAIQAKFTLHELQGPEKGAYDLLMSTKTPGEAGAVFVNEFERPAEVHRARREAAYLGGSGRTAGDGSAPATYAGAGGGYAAPGGYGGTDIASLLALQGNPWVTEKYGGVVDALMGQQFNRQDALWEQEQRMNDPMYQAELEMAQLELERARQPAAIDPFAGTKEIGGVLYGPDGNGGFVPLIAPPPKPGYRPMTAEEGARLGVNPAEYQVSPENKVEKIGGGGTNVTVNTGEGEVGTIPQGYELITDPVTKARTLRPIPGGPEDPAKANEAKASGAAIASDIITTAADRALSANKERALGGIFGSAAALNPSSPNAELYRQVDVLTANAKVENLQAMRNESPTGGALGSVTEKETQMLADQAGALNPASPYFERDLMDYTRNLLRVIHGDEAGTAIFNEKYGSAPDADGWVTLPNGVRVREVQ